MDWKKPKERDIFQWRLLLNLEAIPPATETAKQSMERLNAIRKMVNRFTI